MIYGYARTSWNEKRKKPNLEYQEKSLKLAGAEKIFSDISINHNYEVPEFNSLLLTLQPGDTLIVTKLDRFFVRSISQAADLIKQLIDNDITINILNFGKLDNSPSGRQVQEMFFAFVDLEKSIINERTAEGKTIARQNPNYREGRPKKFSPKQIDIVMSLLKDYSYDKVSAMTGISRATLFRYAAEENSKHYVMKWF